MPEDPPKIDQDRFYLSAEVGKILGVHSSTVRRMAISGQLAFRMTSIGGIRQFRGSDVLLKWLELNQYL